MKTKTINLYQFHELTEEQQAKVLDIIAERLATSS